MTDFTILSSLVFVFYLQTGIYMLWKNPEAPLNRWFFAITLYLALFSLINLLFFVKGAMEVQIVYLRFAGYGALFPLLFRFNLLLTGHPRNSLKHDILFFFFIFFGGGLSLFMIAVLYSFDQSRLHLLEDWVWTNQIAYGLHYGLLLILTVSFFIAFNNWRKKQLWRKQKRRILITVVAINVFAVSLILSDFFISDPSVTYYMRMPHYLLLPWFATIGYGFIHYQFSPPDPAKASHKLLLELKQLLFFCDESGTIFEINPYVAQLSGRQMSEIKGIRIPQLFKEQLKITNLLNETRINGEGGLIYVNIKSQNGMSIPVSLSATSLEDSFGDRFGIAIYGTDQREAIALQEEINRLKDIETSLKTISGDLELQVDRHTEKLMKSLVATKQKMIERKLAEESIKAEINNMEVMMKEIETRVKNNIQIILNLIRLKSNTDSSSTDQIRERILYHRINTILLLNNQVLTDDKYGLVDCGRFLESLADTYCDSWQMNAKIYININATSTLVWVDQALPLAMVANELLNNAIRHAYHNNKDKNTEPVINIVFSITDSNICTLEVQDYGPGFNPGDFLSDNDYSGLNLVKLLVEDQLNGSLELDHDKGVRALISFPLDQKRQGHIGVN